MQDNIYERIHNTLTWKRIAGFNAVLFMVLIVPISVRLAQQDTENRSGAAGEIEVPAVTPPPSYPVGAPKIERVSTFFGKTGDTVILLGSNFGDYKWGSRLFVGSTEAIAESIVRWSNNIVEVKIPDGARTGQVWVVVNDREAKWEGSLLLYDVARSAQVGLQKVAAGSGKIYSTNASMVNRGMIELSYYSEPFTLIPSPGISITSQELLTDSLGKKIRFSFESSTPFTSSRTEIADYSYPGIGAVEIIRAEIFDTNGKMVSVFSDPLSIKVTP